MIERKNFDQEVKDEITERERRKIIGKYRKLLQLTREFTKEKELGLIRKAFDVTLGATKDKRQPSGDPEIYNIMDVTIIVVQLVGLGTRSVVSVLLYQAVINQYITLDEIEQEFDQTIRIIVEGLVKITDIKTTASVSQAENFRLMLLSLIEDVRVILIRLAIVLQHMRTLNQYGEEIQIKTSMEAFSLYAPLAHRLGLYAIKSELENLAMKYTENDVYKDIIKKLKNSTTKRNRFIKKFCEPIEKELQKHALNYEVKGRTKSVYSIWQKMKKQGVEFEEVYDIFAIRIILNSRPSKEKLDCWRAYSIVTDHYQPNPERLRDWISIPKSNGYESLHTTVIGPDKKWVEVQIRTSRMDEVAEKGYAAHWKYKGVKEEKGIGQWMKEVRELLENNATSNGSSLDDLKLSLYNDEVFVFTPQGDLKKLPAGATVLDFAYDVHTDVGYQCVGAKVNHKNVPIKQVLHNGDHIEVITSKGQKPKPDWLGFVVTSKARTKIKAALREEKYKEAEGGKEILERRLKNWKVKSGDLLIDNLLKHYKLNVPVDLYYAIATGKIDVSGIKDLVQENKISEGHETRDNALNDAEIHSKDETTASTDLLVIDNIVKNLDYKFAKCCNPIFGDSVFGFVSISEGIKIHRTSCPNARQLIEKYNYRILKAQWSDKASKQSFQTTIKVTGIDEIGMIGKINHVVSTSMKVRIRSLNIDSNDGMFEGKIKLFVDNTKHLDMIIAKLRKEKGILKVTRIEQEDN